MKKYFIVVLSLLTMYSCKEDDTSWKSDIENLKQELSNQKTLIEAVGKNAYVSGIEEFSDYYTINFSNGQSITLANGKTPQITIGDDGNWYIDGVNTNKPSQGDSPAITIGDNGDWFIDGSDTGVKAAGSDGSDTPTIQSVVLSGYNLTFNLSDGTSTSFLVETNTTDKDKLVTLSDNPLQTINYTAGFAAIFKSWGFIGDSFSSGTMIKEDSTYSFEEMYEYSWGQCLCRLCGSTGYNFGSGGLTTTTWINNQPINGITERTWTGAQQNPKQAYIIALGYNDFHTDYIAKNRSIMPGDLSTDVDYDDYNNNAHTYAGNIAGIIQRLKTVNEDAYFFVSTLPNEYTEYEDWNNVIRDLPNHFSNVYVMDIAKYGPAYDADFKAKYFLFNHMSAAGYQFTAYMYATYIDWIVRNNPSDFRDIALR